MVDHACDMGIVLISSVGEAIAKAYKAHLKLPLQRLCR
jgi:hypothetical protein